MYSRCDIDFIPKIKPQGSFAQRKSTLNHFYCVSDGIFDSFMALLTRFFLHLYTYCCSVNFHRCNADLCLSSQWIEWLRNFIAENLALEIRTRFCACLFVLLFSHVLTKWAHTTTAAAATAVKKKHLHDICTNTQQ